jgi:hypothetical protein
MAKLKLNEIRSVIKWGILIKGVILKGWPRKFAVRRFYNTTGAAESSYKKLMKSLNLSYHYPQFLLC